jgi:Flp pilus assembly pilin Flp
VELYSRGVSTNPKNCNGVTMETLRRFLESRSATRRIECAIIAFGVSMVIIAVINSLGFG